MLNSKPQFLIAAGNSGSGKTTVTLGLLRALKNRGLVVQGFKVGPDFIDTLHHRHASGGKSINLDIFMAGENGVCDEYARYATPADITIVEGVMGLFDGSVRDTASSAHVAKLLGIPVIVMLDASSMAYTAAAILHGLKTFDTELTIAGVIFNFCGSEGHAEMLRDAAESVGIDCLGCIPRTELVTVKSRHLGLNYEAQGDAVYASMASLMEQHVDIDKLVAQTANFHFQHNPNTISEGNLRIAVASDNAFCFTYEHNLRLLAQLGSIQYFSPLSDAHCPEADIVYIPGGYPELFAEQLAANESMKASLIALQRKGAKIFGECGGMMYLGETVETSDGKRHLMCGLLPIATTMKGASISLGYRRIDVEGNTYYGHEFHYSNYAQQPAGALPAHVHTAKGDAVDAPIVASKGAVGSYIHLYWRDVTDLVNFIALAKR